MGSSVSHEELYTKDSTIQGPAVLNGTRLARDTKQKYQFHLQRFQLEPELLKYLQNASIFQLPEAELESNGFKACIDYPTQPKHKYYEGYFHSLPQSTPKHSLNPRHFVPFDKPAAPMELRAFYTAFREINNFDSLKDKLDPGNTRKQFELGWHFADLAVQMHFGVEIKDDNLAWHQDTINSMLHLALSVKGCRGLHLVHTTPDADDDQKHVEHQEYVANRAGDVYLSSPYTFRHAVHYPKTRDFSDRIIAVQARFLLDMNTLTEDVGSQHVITKWLEEAKIRLPTLTEVLEVAKKIENGEYENNKC